MLSYLTIITKMKKLKDTLVELVDLFIIALFLYMLLFLIGAPFGCNKYDDAAQEDIIKEMPVPDYEDDQPMQPGPDPDFIQQEDGTRVLRTVEPLATIANWERLMYVDKTDSIYNSSSARNRFGNYLKTYGFTGVYMYSTSGIVSSTSNYSSFAAFNQTLASNGISFRGVASGSATTFGTTGNITRYNNSQSDPAAKINVANFELEWWNGASSWSNWNTINQQFSTGPIVINDFYEGWYKNLGTTVDTIAARDQVRFSDRILLHCYQNGIPTYSYANARSTGATAGRLDIIAKGARQANKVINLYIIISAENTAWGASYTFTGPALAAARNQINPYLYIEQQAYNNIYNNMTAFQKQWINFRGFVWFTKRYCYAAIPPK